MTSAGVDIIFDHLIIWLSMIVPESKRVQLFILRTIIGVTSHRICDEWPVFNITSGEFPQFPAPSKVIFMAKPPIQMSAFKTHEITTQGSFQSLHGARDLGWFHVKFYMFYGPWEMEKPAICRYISSYKGCIQAERECTNYAKIQTCWRFRCVPNKNLQS